VVNANRTAVVVLKSTFSPRWSVTVDRRPARTELIAPSLVGVTVPPGRHTVVFRYRPFPSHLLIVAAVIGLLGMQLAWRRWRW
jgi:uncharacterized membrane protein YfhO